MAETTINPLKKFFTFDEAALRLGISSDDVMGLALDGKLKISYRYIRIHKKPELIDIRVPSLVALERTKTLWLEDSTGKETHVKREDLLIARDEVERNENAHAPQPAPNETEPQIIEESAKPAPAQDDWIARARKLYHDLKKEHPYLNQVNLAYKIELELKDGGYLGRGDKPLTASNIIRNALQNL